MRQLITIIALGAGCAAHAGLPPLGGPMNHVLVSLDAGNSFSLHVEDSEPMTLVEATSELTGPAAVLNEGRYNAQHGWLVSGLWAPPSGSTVSIELVRADPGLSFFAGRAFGPIAFMEPILGTGGAAPSFNWDGVMLHNYTRADAPGLYEADFRVSITDASGEPLAEYGPGEITLSWVWETDCPADLAAPFGVLDLSDIGLFVNAFTASAPPADLASPRGVLDLSDIGAFVDSFTEGCP